jgi:nucleoside-diphosphate-sugar epimerase
MVRDFLFVDCLVDAVDKLLSVDLPDRRTYFNVGTGDATSIMDLIRKIEFLVGSSVLWSEAAPTKSIIKYSVLDSSELMSAIKWEPLGLEVGLMRYLERDFPGFTKVK